MAIKSSQFFDDIFQNFIHGYCLDYIFCAIYALLILLQYPILQFVLLALAEPKMQIVKLTRLAICAKISIKEDLQNI